jgi:hypothetical protein
VSLSAGEFLPLAPGNNWTYRDAVSGQSFSISVGNPVNVNQRVYYSLRGYTEDVLLVRMNEYGNIVYWDQERERDILLTSFEIVPRAWFEAPHRMCPQEGQPQEAPGIHDGPGGRWSVRDIHYRTFACADAGDQLEQFTENIGMVRRVVTTIAGPRTFDLVYARIGNQVITAGNAGSFSVTATPGPEPGTWLATLRVDRQDANELILRFSSGQQFELKLRDGRRNILWTWSADKLFLQAENELRITSGWSATVTVPHPPAIPEARQVYTLEAWLTTAEREPSFSAVATVEVPGIAAPRTARARH